MKTDRNVYKKTLAKDIWCHNKRISVVHYTIVTGPELEKDKVAIFKYVYTKKM